MRLSRTIAVIEDGIRQGLHSGAQLYVRHAGEVVADVGIGESRPGVPMRPETITLWMSSVKPVTAIAVAILWEQGRLRLDDPVASHIPEFGRGGKEAITVRQVLTHTGGFRAAGGNTWGPEDWDAIVARICSARIEPRWTPGQKAGYHVASGWLVLGELVRRLDGRPIDRFVRETIYEPLGMHDSWIGMPSDAFHRYDGRLAVSYRTHHGPPDPATPAPTEEDVALVRPGGNGRGPIRELGRFYEMLLNHGELDGARILSAQTVEAVVARHRAGMFDETFKHVMDWGLGFIVNSQMYGEHVPYGYGPHASRRTFGHSGYESSSAFCDPENDLVVAWVTNGFAGDEQHNRRQRAINTAVYEDLGLAAAS